MNGHAVARALRAYPALAYVPIVAVTSYAVAGDREQAIDAGCARRLLPSQISSSRYAQTDAERPTFTLASLISKVMPRLKSADESPAIYHSLPTQRCPPSSSLGPSKTVLGWDQTS